MPAPVPTSFEDLTPAWLTDALTDAGILAGETVTAVEMEEIGVGRGYVGLTLRLRPTYDRPRAGLPASVVAKLPTFVEVPPDLAQFIDLLYVTEIRWYQELRARCPLNVPEFVWAGMDQPRHRYCLLLQDMGSLRMMDQVGSCSREDAFLAVRELARLHAAHWNDPALSAEWLPGLPLMTMLTQMIYMGGWEQFWAQLGPQLPAEFEEIGSAIGPAMGALLAMLESGARTLVHGDYRLENFMFDDPGKLVVLDWQIAHSGGGGQDLAYFVAQNLTVEARRELEQDLIRAYYDTLVAGGLDYSFERCLRDYRAGLLVGMAIPVNGVRAFQEVSATGGGDHLTEDQRELVGRALESGFALIQTMTERNVAAIFDNNAHELLHELAASSAASS
jgi:hypothetical protein